MILEEFKGCLPTEIKTYLDEQKVDNLHQAATQANDYALTHRGSFSRPNPRSLDATNIAPGETKYSQGGGANPQDSRDKNGSHQSGSSRVPLGPMCYYCKQKAHITVNRKDMLRLSVQP